MLERHAGILMLLSALAAVSAGCDRAAPAAGPESPG